MSLSPSIMVSPVAPVRAPLAMATPTPWKTGDWLQLLPGDDGQWTLQLADAALAGALGPDAPVPAGAALTLADLQTLASPVPLLVRVLATAPQLTLQVLAPGAADEAATTASRATPTAAQTQDASSTVHAMQPDWALWQRRDMGAAWVHTVLGRSEMQRASASSQTTGAHTGGLPTRALPTQAGVSTADVHIPFAMSASAREWLDEALPLLQRDEPVVGLSGHPVWMSALPLNDWLSHLSGPAVDGSARVTGGAPPSAAPHPYLTVLTLWRDQPLAWELYGQRHALGLIVTAASASALSGMQRHWPHWAFALARSGWRLKTLLWKMSNLPLPHGHQTHGLDALLVSAAAELLAALH